MQEEVIVTKRGIFGRVQITLPMTAKASIMRWIKNSGMGKAEFLRAALLIGASTLAEQVSAKNPGEKYISSEDQVLSSLGDIQ